MWYIWPRFLGTLISKKKKKKKKTKQTDDCPNADAVTLENIGEVNWHPTTPPKNKTKKQQQANKQ